MDRRRLLVLGALLLAGCSSGGAAPGRTDSRVTPLRGQVPPELTGGQWLNAPPTTLAALRGRVVFVQFAFPT